MLNCCVIYYITKLKICTYILFFIYIIYSSYAYVYMQYFVCTISHGLVSYTTTKSNVVLSGAYSGFFAQGDGGKLKSIHTS